MALRPLQAQMPLGQFDGLDGDLASLKGGEVVGFTTVAIVGTDKHAEDVDDGYVGVTDKRRPVVTKTLSTTMRPLFLADEGIRYYGTLFGEVVGSSVGQVVTGGTQLGPHTTAGSGKVTLWGTPGLYAVTLDAVDTTASTGLAPTNTTLSSTSKLYATTAGLLTPNIGSSFEAVAVARFIEFQTNGSLVTTPNFLVSADNSPTGTVGQRMVFDSAVIWFSGPTIQ